MSIRKHCFGKWRQEFVTDWHINNFFNSFFDWASEKNKKDQGNS
jgi:hypothetical protein